MALQTVAMRCCDDLLILKGVDRHEKVGKASLNPLCGDKICMDGVDMMMLDVEDAHHSAGHSCCSVRGCDSTAIRSMRTATRRSWGVVKIGSVENMLERRREDDGEQTADDVRDWVGVQGVD